MMDTIINDGQYWTVTNRAELVRALRADGWDMIDRGDYLARTDCYEPEASEDDAYTRFECLVDPCRSGGLYDHIEDYPDGADEDDYPYRFDWVPSGGYWELTNIPRHDDRYGYNKLGYTVDGNPIE